VQLLALGCPTVRPRWVWWYWCPRVGSLTLPNVESLCGEGELCMELLRYSPSKMTETTLVKPRVIKIGFFNGVTP
jgi:hypothetical protein